MSVHCYISFWKLISLGAAAVAKTFLFLKYTVTWHIIFRLNNCAIQFHSAVSRGGGVSRGFGGCSCVASSRDMGGVVGMAVLGHSGHGWPRRCARFVHKSGA